MPFDRPSDGRSPGSGWRQAGRSLTDVRTLMQVREESVAGDTLQARLFGIFTGVAITLAAIGSRICHAADARDWHLYSTY